MMGRVLRRMARLVRSILVPLVLPVFALRNAAHFLVPALAPGSLPIAALVIFAAVFRALMLLELQAEPGPDRGRLVRVDLALAVFECRGWLPVAASELVLADPKVFEPRVSLSPLSQRRPAKKKSEPTAAAIRSAALGALGPV